MPEAASVAENEQAMKRFDPDSVSKTVALAGTGCLLLSVIYDWGFIRAVGLSFPTLPTSLSDHLRGALNWLPGTLAYIGIAAVFELVSRRIEGGLTEEELLAGSKRPAALRRFRDSPHKFIGALMVMIIILWVMLGDSFRDGLSLAVPVAWLDFSALVISHKKIRERTSRSLLLGFAFLPATVASVYLLGDSAGHAALKDVDAPGVTLVTEAADAKRDLVLVRVFERVAIVRDGRNTVSVIRTPDILRIEPPAQAPYRGLSCAFWQPACTVRKSGAGANAPTTPAAGSHPAR